MTDKEIKENLQEQNGDEQIERKDDEVVGEKVSQKEENQTDTNNNKDSEINSEEGSQIDKNIQKGKEPKVATTPSAKIEEAKKLVENADRELDECIGTLKKDIQEFEEYEKESLKPIIDKSRSLLNMIGIDDEEIGELPEIKADISENKSSEKMYVRELSSGRGGAFFFGLIGGLATLAAWCAFGAFKAGLSIPPSNMDMATIEKISSKLAETIGFGSNAQIGMGIAIASAILVFIIIYSIKVSLQSAKNEEIAKETQEKAKEYSKKKRECKVNLEAIDEHIKDLKDTALKYEVLLDEKNAALRRAIRIEAVANINDMHEITKKEVEHMITLIKEIERLIEAPVTENGVLNQDSVALLNETKTLLQKHIDNIYN